MKIGGEGFKICIRITAPLVICVLKCRPFVVCYTTNISVITKKIVVGVGKTFGSSANAVTAFAVGFLLFIGKKYYFFFFLQRFNIVSNAGRMVFVLRLYAWRKLNDELYYPRTTNP